MKTRNKTVNILTAIVATLLSFVLVIVLFGTALVGTARRAVTPQAIEGMIHTAMQSIDFETILIGSAEENDISQEELAQAEILSKILGSDAAQEFFALYAQDMAAALAGTYTADTAAVNGQVVRDLVDANIDQIVDILGDLDTEADREQIRQELLNYVEENADTLLGELSVENLVQDSGMTDIIEVINVLPTLLWILIAVCAVLAGLIYACRWYRFGGLVWLGVDTAIVTLFMYGITRVIKSDLLVSMVGALDAEQDILTALFAAIGSVFTTVTLILLGLTVLFIGGYIALKYTILKQRDAAATDTVFTVGDSLPAEEPVVEALPTTEETL